jgi:hypothetical protein
MAEHRDQPGARPAIRPSVTIPTSPPLYDDHASHLRSPRTLRRSATRISVRFSPVDDGRSPRSPLTADNLYTIPSNTMERIVSVGAESSRGRKDLPGQPEYVGSGREPGTPTFSRGHKPQASVGIASVEEARFDLQNYRAWLRRQRKKARDNTWVKLETGFNAWYQTWIIERLLRQYVAIPPPGTAHPFYAITFLCCSDWYW